MLKRTALRKRCSFGEAAKVWKGKVQKRFVEFIRWSFRLVVVSSFNYFLDLSPRFVGFHDISNLTTVAYFSDGWQKSTKLRSPRWVETSRRATYSMWLDVWRRPENAGFFTVFGKREESISPAGALDITNICQKGFRITCWHWIGSLPHFNFFSWVQMDGCLIVRCVESLVPEFRCHFIRQPLWGSKSFMDSWVSSHRTDAYNVIQESI